MKALCSGWRQVFPREPATVVGGHAYRARPQVPAAGTYAGG